MDAVAARSGSDIGVLQDLVQGKAGISTDQLDRVAEVLDLDPVALLSGIEKRRTQPATFLKHGAWQDFDHRLEAPLQRALSSARMLLDLNECLRLPLGERRADPFPVQAAPSASAVRAAEDGYRLAEVLRRRLNNRAGPLPDLGELLEERFEVVVEVVDLGKDDVTAVGVRDDSGAAAIILNAVDRFRQDNPQLTRVQLAHELCHILHDPSEGGVHLVLDLTEEESAAGQRSHEREEQRARGFAAELLLPLHGLIEVLGTPSAVVEEARGLQLVAQARRHFSTPWEIAVHHLYNRGYLSYEVHQLLQQSGAQGTSAGNAKTRLPKPGEHSIAFAHRVRQAHRAGIITDGQAKVALSLPRYEPLPWD